MQAKKVLPSVAGERPSLPQRNLQPTWESINRYTSSSTHYFLFYFLIAWLSNVNATQTLNSLLGWTDHNIPVAKNCSVCGGLKRRKNLKIIIIINVYLVKKKSTIYKGFTYN